MKTFSDSDDSKLGENNNTRPKTGDRTYVINPRGRGRGYTTFAVKAKPKPTSLSQA